MIMQQVEVGAEAVLDLEVVEEDLAPFLVRISTLESISDQDLPGGGGAGPGPVSCQHLLPIFLRVMTYHQY
jgi:hypothetical protein